jgi:two-component system response regulator
LTYRLTPIVPIRDTGTLSLKNVAIIVAEDDEGERYLLQKAFEDVGIHQTVDYVSNGLELVEYVMANASVPSGGLLVVLDLNMPVMDGREALKAIRSDPHLRHIPVVVLTNSRNPADVYGAYRDGANGFFTKPFTYTELLDLVTVLKRYWIDSATMPLAG